MKSSRVMEIFSMDELYGCSRLFLDDPITTHEHLKIDCQEGSSLITSGAKSLCIINNNIVNKIRCFG